MARVTTLPEMWWPLMDAPSVETPWCAVCGKTGHIERHHMVRRSAGRLYRDGIEVPKPTITLCGFGNASGCHGLAHQGRLHFKYEDGLLWYRIGEPMPYQRALETGGWVPLRRCGDEL